jgi:hypothetical protein
MKVQFKSIKINIRITEIFLIISLLGGGMNNIVNRGEYPNNVETLKDSPRGD